MKAFPNTTKWQFKKLHKPNYKFTQLTERKAFLPMAFEYAIQASQSGKITYKQLESCRRALRRGLGKSSRILFCIFTNTPVSTKPVASRMGKGKGNISFWVAVVKEGRILIEITCVNKGYTRIILEKASTKLPIRTKILQLYF